MDHIYYDRTFRDIPIISNKNWKDTKHINIHENAQNIQRFKNAYNQRMWTGGRYDKRKVRHWAKEGLSKTTTHYYLPTMFRERYLTVIQIGYSFINK